MADAPRLIPPPPVVPPLVRPTVGVGSPAMRSQRFNVGQAPATLLLDQAGADRDVLAKVRNTHATQAVDVGDATVVTGAGYEVKAGEVQEFRLARGDKLYAVSGAGLTTPVEVEWTSVDTD